jgi:putative oxidoreductase
MFERIFGGFSHWATIPLRVAIGLIFAAHGWQKFSMGLDGVARFFGSVGIPLPEVSAFIVAFVELVGGIGLIVGSLHALLGALALDCHDRGDLHGEAPQRASGRPRAPRV